MLIAQRYFQMINVFTVALKTEVTGFDYAGVNRSDGDVMNFRAFQTEKIGDADRHAAPAGRIRFFGVAFMEANWFEPGVPFRLDCPLLVYLPLKPVRLRTVRGQRRVCIADVRRHNRQYAPMVVGQHCKKTYCRGLRRLS
ncbi:MAG: hypothetical protein BWY83_02604 [bacterium ADurb.Bin478]|nr:MAG: hypothetical protein BWY83_02604 [bacterium ADurb.Bin478]